MIRKFKFRGQELEFKMTNKTIFDIDEKYDNFGDVINGLMYGKNLYNNAIRVLECSCLTPLDAEELKAELEPNQVTKELVPFATQLYLDYMGVKKSKEPQDHKEKENKKK